jgi:hypothetical protein
MTHLSPDELIDALDGVRHQAHLACCERCQRELAELAAVLADAKQASVPEPSPLFWPHFSQRVRTAIDGDARRENAWRSWLRWQVLLPLGAVTMIILALISVPEQNRAERETAAAELVAPAAPVAPAGPDAPASTDSWVVLADLVGEMDLDTATAAGVVAPGVAEQAVLQLTADEQQELTRLLKAELTRAKL